MKFDMKKFKLYFLTLLSAVFGTPKEWPIEIDIYIADDVEPKFVKDSLLFIPQLWKFNFIDTLPPCYTYQSGDWKGYLIPSVGNTVVVFDGNKRDVKYAGGCVATSAGIAKFSHNTDELGFGLRIWHELLHAQKIDSDAMLCSPEFEAWLESQFKYILTENRTAYQHSIQFQILFYNFLTRKFVRG